MSGYFYAYASQATARAAKPDWFDQDDDGEWYLVGERVCVSTKGVWLVDPVMSEPDENGDQTILTPGERSADYVILSPEQDGSEAKLITPASHQGFA